MVCIMVCIFRVIAEIARHRYAKFPFNFYENLKLTKGVSNADFNLKFASFFFIFSSLILSLFYYSLTSF